MSELSARLLFTGQEVLAILEEEEDTQPYRCLHPRMPLHTLEKRRELPTMILGDSGRRRTTYLHRFCSGTALEVRTCNAPYSSCAAILNYGMPSAVIG